MTRSDRDNVLGRLMDIVGTDNSAMDLLEKLRDDDYEDVRPREFEGEDWRRKYEDLYDKFKKRFFGRPDEAVYRQEEDIKKDTETAEDSEEITIDDLFEEKEGN